MWWYLKNRISLGTLVLISLLCCGCNSQNSKNNADAALPAWLTENQSAAIPAAETPPATQLRLNLQAGDQFPLRKTVQQELIQHPPGGTPMRSHSQLELMMAITVLEKRDERVKLSVRYDRVKYKHDVAEEHLEFDSTRPGEVPTVGMTAYRDMVNDGFAFWIGADNQIVEVEGLSEFMQRCLRNVPPEKHQDVIFGIEAESGAEIANFVDNTIGLLPYQRSTAPGESWERQQHISRPVPLHMTNIYTLKELTANLAVIDVRGTVSPSTPFNQNRSESEKGVSVIVRGGSAVGSCTIYRETGLPKESRVDRIIEMSVVADNSVVFPQTKRVTKIVESFPTSTQNSQPIRVASPRSNTPPNAMTSPVIEQVSGESPVSR